MAQPDMKHYPAAEAGTGLDRRQSGLLSMARTGQPPEQWAAARSELGQQRMLHAIRSVGLAAARPASPLAARHAGAMIRISAVLASWRATERELRELPESSPDRPRLRAVLEGLRVTHHRLFSERRDDTSGALRSCEDALF